MSFSRGQQGHFRRLVGWAWTAFKKDFPDAAKCKKQQRCGECDYCRWYEGALLRATGNSSTSDCNPKGDFEAAMAEFEQLAGSGFQWNLKLEKGDQNRVLWKLRDVAFRAGFSEEYIVAIARTPFEKRKQHFPGLEALTIEHLVKVLGAVKRQASRRKPEAVSDPF